MSQLTGNDPLPAEVKQEVAENFLRKLAIFVAKNRVLPVLLPAEVGHFRKSATLTYPLVFEFLKFVENCGLERPK